MWIAEKRGGVPEGMKMHFCIPESQRIEAQERLRGVKVLNTGCELTACAALCIGRLLWS
jgi:hypothetical protein